jgi:hypothetical protein
LDILEDNAIIIYATIILLINIICAGYKVYSCLA